MFEREHHRRIANVLEALDAELLESHGCLFGGGTAIVLRHGEFRESLDVDLLSSSPEGYRALRRLATGRLGLGAFVRPGAALETTRDIRADQYGVRTRVRVLESEIKLEIVFEARIALDPPGPEDRVCGIATLTPRDMAATKLLANSDRWSDAAVNSRDVIDLAMLQPGPALLRAAKEKARSAYGETVDRDLKKAVDRFARDPRKLEQCMRALQMEVPRALVWQRLKALVRTPAKQPRD